MDATAPRRPTDEELRASAIAHAKRRAANDARHAAYTEHSVRSAAHRQQRHAERKRIWVLGALSPILVFRLTTALKQFLCVVSGAEVVYYKNLGRHTQERHADHGPEALSSGFPKSTAQFLGDCRAEKDHERELYFTHLPKYHLRVVVKFLRAEAGRSQDECWVKTIHKIKDRKLNGRRKSGRFAEVQ